MSDDLDSKTDRELDELFATTVAGWGIVPTENGQLYGYKNNAISYDVAAMPPQAIPEFTTSADDVLPWLENHRWKAPCEETTVTIFRDSGKWTVILPAASWNDSGFSGTAPTFAKAACLALLRAKRAEKGTP